MSPNTLKFDTIDHAQHNNDYVNKAIGDCKIKPKAFVILKDSLVSFADYNVVFSQIDGMFSALQKNVPTINGYTTVVNSDHFDVYSKDTVGVNSWLFSNGIDTNKIRQQILIIRKKQR